MTEIRPNSRPSVEKILGYLKSNAEKIRTKEVVIKVDF